MKKIVAYEGGHPFAIDDLLYLQNIVADSFAQLSKIWGDYFVLSGCQRTDTTYTITLPGFPPAVMPAYQFAAGYVCIGGEICQFPGQIILQQDYDTANFVINEANDGAAIVYEDGQLRSVYKNRTASIASGTIGVPGNVPTVDFSRREWRGGIFINTDNNEILVRRVNDTVEFGAGEMSVNADLPLVNSTYGGKLFPNPLPPVLRPATTRVLHVVVWPDAPAAPTANSIRKITIVGDGNVYINSRFATNGRIVLTGLSYPIKGY